MQSSEKFNLKWNDFKENLYTGIGSLKNSNDFADVTLACEEGHQVEAHKVILGAASPFFQNLLLRNNHTHPLIYMRGMKYDELVAIVDFLYYGEADIYQEHLDSFLALAEELELKGLSGNMNEPHLDKTVSHPQSHPKTKQSEPRKISNNTKTNKTKLTQQKQSIS